ncbi:MAG TPA: hypothetical protein VLX89_03155 [Actinomycetota bacterium]|nr:hypothetical protein [Actinomycetota bacterium]
MRRSAAATVAALVVVTCALSSVAFAASLAPTSRTLGAGKVAVPSCDAGGFTIVQNLTGANVSSVTIGGIAATCATGTLSVTVNNGTTNSSGTAVVPAGGGSMTVTLAAAVAFRQANEVDVAIVGP